MRMTSQKTHIYMCFVGCSFEMTKSCWLHKQNRRKMPREIVDFMSWTIVIFFLLIFSPVWANTFTLHVHILLCRQLQAMAVKWQFFALFIMCFCCWIVVCIIFFLLLFIYCHWALIKRNTVQYNECSGFSLLVRCTLISSTFGDCKQEKNVKRKWDTHR